MLFNYLTRCCDSAFNVGRMKHSATIMPMVTLSKHDNSGGNLKEEGVA